MSEIQKLNILVVNSSGRGEGSTSRRVCEKLVDKMTALDLCGKENNTNISDTDKEGRGRIVYRDADALPFVDEDFVTKVRRTCLTHFQ